jgi:FkbM family methyltransferase
MGRESKPRKILRGLPAGFSICVSPVEHLGYLLGTVEPHLQTLIKEYVRPGATAYDVGANIGYVSLSLAKWVGASGQVFAFEPIPQSVAALRKNVEINRLSNIQILEVAVSDKRGKAIVRVSENLSTASLVWHQNDSSAMAIEIQTTSIDELVKAGSISEPSFVKIDVEGAEDKVLLGMRDTLTAARPVLFVECSDLGRETAWNLLRSLEYSCQSAITRKGINTLAEYRHSDFLWLPSK